MCRSVNGHRIALLPFGDRASKPAFLLDDRVWGVMSSPYGEPGSQRRGPMANSTVSLITKTQAADREVFLWDTCG